jgi:hypothetical protein
MTELTERQQMMAAAIKKRMRLSEEKKAQMLRDRGWTCVPPAEDVDAVNWAPQTYDH